MKGLQAACFLFSLMAAAAGCGNKKCTQDTDCKLPQVCMDGQCTYLYVSDASSDVILDLDSFDGEPQPDIIDTPVETFPDISEDPGPGDQDDVAEIVEEDLEEEELPPATIIWEEDFSEGADLWVSQFGDWSVVGGEYVQSNDDLFAEAWVPGETSWTDYAVEVSLSADSFNSGALVTTLGLLFRVQDIIENFYYLCGFDYVRNELKLVRYNQDEIPGYERLCTVEDLTPALEVGVWYKLQVVVSGTRIACRWLSSDVAQIEFFTADEAYPNGSIGLMAGDVAGRFDNIVVWDHRPSEWPAPIIREHCP